MLVVLLLTVVCLLLTWFYLQFRWKYRHVIAAANKLPCPPTWPIIGNAALFIGDNNSITKNLSRLTTKLKNTFCLWVGPVPLFVVLNPSDLQVVLNSSSTLEKSSSYNMLRVFFGSGILTSPAPIWKKYRRLINTLMFPSNLEQFTPVFNEVARKLADEVATGSRTIDPTNVYFNAAISAISSTVITKQRVDRDSRMKVQILIGNAGGLVNEAMYKPWLQIQWVARLFCSKINNFMKQYDEMVAVYDKLWQEDLKGKKNNQTLHSNGSKGDRHKTILDLSLEHPPSIGEDHNWTDERSTMIVAGSDTVVSALLFLTITLANETEEQERILKEIQEKVGDLSDVTVADLNSLTYLGQAIMESIRLHGAVPMILRKVTKDTKLSTCVLPSGCDVMMPLYALGRDEQVFPEPDKFLPDRFSPEASKSRHVYSFLPFSRGPRDCIGKTYAMLFIKTVIVHLLRRFKLTTQIKLSDIEYEAKIVTCSRTKLIIKFENR